MPMSKKDRKAARLARKAAELELRASNGRASVKDIDFLERMTALNGGRDPYTNAPIPPTSGPVHSYYGGQPYHDNYQHNQRQRDMFSTSSYKPSVTVAKGEDGVFHCAETDELTKECPIAKVPEIFFNNRQWDILMHCTEEYDTEWIALLFGSLESVEGKPTYVIRDFYFPPQTASGTHVDVPVEVRPKPGVIGAIHSHVNMGVFFSGTDVAHSNWPVEIVINREREYEAVARHQLKCGEFAKNKAKVYVTGSTIPVAIKAQLDLAFIQGKEIEAKAKLSSSKRGSDKVPYGVAKEDQEEVKTAIVKGSVSSTTVIVPSEKERDKPASSVFQVCTCGHSEIRHAQGDHTICLDKECNCREFAAIPSSPEAKCPEKDCTRGLNHPGWHRDKSLCYYMTRAEQDAWEIEEKAAKQADADPDDLSLTFPFGASSSTVKGEGLALSTILSDELTADIPDDLEEEDYCLVCDGTSFCSLPGNPRITIVCRACQGSGLTESGLRKVREHHVDTSHSVD
jgi:proteasome lid subunit RPN8/RPN11